MDADQSSPGSNEPGADWPELVQCGVTVLRWKQSERTKMDNEYIQSILTGLKLLGSMGKDWQKDHEADLQKLDESVWELVNGGNES